MVGVARKEREAGRGKGRGEGGNEEEVVKGVFFKGGKGVSIFFFSVLGAR